MALSNLSGVIPPMTTPFDAEGEIDEAALRADVNYLIEVAGVHGVAVGGSTGEGHTLTADEFTRLVTVTCEAVAGRIPVVAGIIVNSTREAIARARAVSHLDVAALQVTPVHYLFRPTDEAMFDHFKALAEATDIPVLIYNVVPWTYLSPQLLNKIIRDIPGVIGVKQSAGDLKLMADLLLLLEDNGLVLAATDALLYSAYTLGAHGSVAAILQAAPKLSVALWQAVRAGDHSAALTYHQKLLHIWNAIEDQNLPANVKTAMALTGRNGGLPRAPMPVSSETQRLAIKAAIEAENIL